MSLQPPAPMEPNLPKPEPVGALHRSEHLLDGGAHLPLAERQESLSLALSAALQPAFSLLRSSCPGELQLRHGVEIAHLLVTWGADETLIAAGLLHEVVYNELVDVEDVARACTPEVAALCADYRARFGAPAPAGWRGRDEILRRGRVYAAAYANPRLALLCVAHMWHSLLFTAAGRALPTRAQAVSPSQTSSLGLSRDEAQSVLLPVLDMLGMRELRDHLAAFPGHGSEASGVNSGGRAGRPTANEVELLRTVVDAVADRLPEVRLTLRDGPFGPGERTQSADRSADRMHGQIANLQVVVATPADCYLALHQIHGLYKPVDGALVDTVSAGRRNGYRSLQSAVVAGDGRRWLRLNLEIVTPAMDEVNRWGVAAFVLAGRSAPPVSAAGPWAGVWWRDSAAGDAKLRAAPQASSSAETIAVFSPLGEIFTFERGSSVVDYAYHVHSDLAEQCQRFYVNGESVEPATVLRHMDLVELEINPRASGPTTLWLNAARTNRARSSIRRFLRRQTRGITEGQRILEARLHDLATYYGFQIADHRVEDAITRGARYLGMKTSDDLLAEMAAGRAAVDRYLHPLFAEEIARRVDLPRSLHLRPHLIALAQCCKPRPGDEVMGLPARHGGVITKLTLHKKSCPRYLALGEAVHAEAMPLRWKLRSTSKILTQLEVTARDEDGLLGEALHQVYAVLPRVTLLKTDATARRGTARLRFNFEADSPETVEEIADALRRLPNREVTSVRQLALPPSEQEALHADSAGASNPYSRMPVHDHSMFFGRFAELARLDEWLHNSVSCIWLRGQKRVGKTSLMLHLKRDFWEPHDAVCAYVDFQLLSNLAQANIFYEVAAAVYTELRDNAQVAAMGAPDRTLFANDSPLRLHYFLRDVQQRLGTRRVVVLIDEFSRITDLYLNGQMSADFFQQWRGLLQSTERFAAFITVVQQKTFEHMREHMRAQQLAQIDDPCWHVLELGETMHLKPFSHDDARRLVEWPMRNFMDYAPGVPEEIVAYTGGSPFLIQAFCNKLVAHLTRAGSRTAEEQDIHDVAEEFMQPSESIFAHLLDQAMGIADHICTQAALIAEHEPQALVSWDALRAATPQVSAEMLRRTLDQLATTDILAAPEEGLWRFNSRLFQHWLALHS